MDKTKKIRIILWAGLIFLTFFFLWMGIVPFGRIMYLTDFRNQNSFIGRLTPQERLGVTSRSLPNKIIGDPVYFSLFTPRTFDKAKVTVEYKNNSNAQIIEAGVLMDKVVWRYDLRPLENKVIDELMQNWDVVQEDGLILIQKKKNFSSIYEFKDNLPKRDRIALYNTSISQEYLIPDYQATTDLHIINHPLRGAYEFYTYIKDEDLDFNFTIEDLNQNQDSDEIDVFLYYEDQVIDSRHLVDDGIATDNRKIVGQRNLSLETKNLPEGVYKIEFKANDDVLTKKIETRQSKIAFIDKLRLAVTGQEGFSLFTDGQRLSALTVNPGSRQVIQIGDDKLEISETYKQFATNIVSEEIELKKDGVLLSTDGVLAFSSDAMVNPRFKKVGTEINLEKVDYILADYKTPKQLKNGWKQAEIEIDLKNAYREDGKYSFIISAPGLQIDDGQAVELDKIIINLKGRSLIEKLKSFYDR